MSDTSVTLSPHSAVSRSIEDQPSGAAQKTQALSMVLQPSNKALGQFLTLRCFHTILDATGH